MLKKHNRKTRQKLKKSAILAFAILLFLVSITLLWYHPFLKTQAGTFLNPLGSEKMVTLLQIQTALAKKNIGVISITEGANDTVFVKLTTGATAIFSKTKDITLQISSLQLIATRLTIEGKKFSKIDFRFDKPVLSY